MPIRKMFLILVLFSTLVACGNGNKQLSGFEIPSLVSAITISDSERIPKALAKKIELLEINESDIVEKELGYPARLKIIAFNVAAYARYDDGWLVASGRGEWGGVLYWIDNTGSFEIIRDDDLAYPIDLMADGEKLFLIQGMNHLGLADGHLLEIFRESGKFSTQAYPINGYPTGFKKEGEDWLIPVGLNNGYYVLSELRAGKSIFHSYN